MGISKRAPLSRDEMEENVNTELAKHERQRIKEARKELGEHIKEALMCLLDLHELEGIGDYWYDRLDEALGRAEDYYERGIGYN